jgi:hypothetical protein
MVGDNKEVYFHEYCKKCLYRNQSEDNPKGQCWDCLESPVNVDSHKPINFKEAENESER